MSNLICCYCKKVMKYNYGTMGDSHGACPECAKKVMDELNAEIRPIDIWDCMNINISYNNKTGITTKEEVCIR